MSATPSSPEARAIREGLALSLVPEIGCSAFRERVEKHGSAADALLGTVPLADRYAALREADAILAHSRRAGARVILLGEPEYPEPLLHLPDAPSVIFTLGRNDLWQAPMVSIVGTRHASASGERLAHRLAAEFARRGVVVVSGMAFGIDAAAHRGALSVGGGTIAVLGGGCDRPYPPSHRALHREICEQGTVVSEAHPGTHPGKGAFPRRNRIIAALGGVLIVVEAGERSGALITANQALDLGRTVGAVPGAVDSPRHIGTNRLLKDGATMITGTEDALMLAGLALSEPAPSRARRARSSPRRARDAAAARSSPELAGAPEAATGSTEADPMAQAVLGALRTGASELDDLRRLTSLEPRALGAAIASLEVAGKIWTDHAGAVRLAR